MIRDDELHNSLDYSVGQREAAHRILVELANLFNAYKDDIRIVGGWGRIMLDQLMYLIF